MPPLDRQACTYLALCVLAAGGCHAEAGTQLAPKSAAIPAPSNSSYTGRAALSPFAAQILASSGAAAPAAPGEVPTHQTVFEALARLTPEALRRLRDRASAFVEQPSYAIRTEYDNLIIGGGYAALLMACELAIRGEDFLVVGRDFGIYDRYGDMFYLNSREPLAPDTPTEHPLPSCPVEPRAFFRAETSLPHPSGKHIAYAGTLGQAGVVNWALLGAGHKLFHDTAVLSYRIVSLNYDAQAGSYQGLLRAPLDNEYELRAKRVFLALGQGPDRTAAPILDEPAIEEYATLSFLEAAEVLRDGTQDLRATLKGGRVAVIGSGAGALISLEYLAGLAPPYAYADGRREVPHGLGGIGWFLGRTLTGADLFEVVSPLHLPRYSPVIEWFMRQSQHAPAAFTYIEGRAEEIERSNLIVPLIRGDEGTAQRYHAVIHAAGYKRGQLRLELNGSYEVTLRNLDDGEESTGPVARVCPRDTAATACYPELFAVTANARFDNKPVGVLVYAKLIPELMQSIFGPP